jgi:Flp pilus assembly protein TadG
MRSTRSAAVSSRLRDRRLRGDDGGAAVVEFVLVSVLLVFLLFAILQVAVLFYARNIVAASAADGARYAASSNQDASLGGRRASAEIGGALTNGVAHDVPCVGSADVDGASGLPTTVVRCTGQIRSIFLPFGAFVHLDATARALTEPAS